MLFHNIVLAWIFIHLPLSRGQRSLLCVATVALLWPSKFVWKLSSVVKRVNRMWHSCLLLKMYVDQIFMKCGPEINKDSCMHAHTHVHAACIKLWAGTEDGTVAPTNTPGLEEGGSSRGLSLYKHKSAAILKLNTVTQLSVSYSRWSSQW